MTRLCTKPDRSLQDGVTGTQPVSSNVWLVVNRVPCNSVRPTVFPFRNVRAIQLGVWKPPVIWSASESPVRFCVPIQKYPQKQLFYSPLRRIPLHDMAHFLFQLAFSFSNPQTK